MKCNIITYKGNAALGVNEDASYKVKIALVYKYYPHNTLKKLCFKLYVLLVFIFKLDRFIFKSAYTSLNSAVDSLNVINAPNVLIRYHSLSYKSRCYCFFADVDLKLLSFSKLAFNEMNNSLLKLESYNIKKLPNSILFKTPTVLNEYEAGGCFGFSLSAIANDYYVHEKKARFINPTILAELQGDISCASFDSFSTEMWWEAIHKIMPATFIANCTTLHLSRIHGDLGSENILESTDNKPLYIIDWERTNSRAPYLTDALAYWLGSYHKEILKSSDEHWLKNLFYDEFVKNYKCDDMNALAALGYLVSVDFDLAIELAKSCGEFKL